MVRDMANRAVAMQLVVKGVLEVDAKVTGEQ
jgi:hypothetical protein